MSACPSAVTSRAGRVVAATGQRWPSVTVGPLTRAHLPRVNPVLCPSTSWVSRAAKKSPLTATAHRSRSAMADVGSSVVCHGPGPSGSGPPIATWTDTRRSVRSTVVTKIDSSGSCLTTWRIMIGTGGAVVGPAAAHQMAIRQTTTRIAAR